MLRVLYGVLRLGLGLGSRFGALGLGFGVWDAGGYGFWAS